jgi:TolB-like protein/Tfp pilus assembly protein PilF
MTGRPNNLGEFWKELKRRKVIRRNMVYAATGFVILEFISNITEPFGLPDWTLKLVFIILCIGFVISIILSWFYDFTPDGPARIKSTASTKEVPSEKPAKRLSWKIATYISFVIIAGLLVLNIVRGGKKSEDLTGLEKSIAVLPFENMSIDDEHSYIGDAMSDEIIMQLKNIKEFRVISRTSTLKYKDTKQTVPTIAQELNVNYLVEGSVQRQDDNVRIRVQVIRARNEDHIWGETYDKEWKDIFSIQSDVAQKIANELEAILSPEEIQRIDKRPTENLDAYEMYLQGRHFWNKRSEEGIKIAIEFFRDAIEKDTNYALAYAGLADSYSMLARYGYISSKEGVSENFHKAKNAGLMALKIDNTLAEAYSSLAYVKMYYDWDWNEVLKDFERAIQLNPGYETAHHWLSIWFVCHRRYDEAVEAVRRAQELDPFSPVINNSVVRRLYEARKYDIAFEEAQRAIKITPDFFLTHQMLGLIYLQKGMFSEAVLEMQKAARYSGNSPNIKAYLGYIYSETGNQAKAEEILNELIESSKNEYVPSTAFTVIYTGLNDHDNAISWLEQAYEEKSPMIIYLNALPEFDPLRSDPRFIELLRKMNFEY